MTTVRQILRSFEKLGLSPRSGARHLRPAVRRASTLTQVKVIEGGNGERMMPSPYGEVSYSGMFVDEYLWRNYTAYPDHIALECGVSGRKYTYSQARDAANCIAKSLIDMGLKRGNVVALIAPNYPETILAFLGALEARLVVTTVNPYYTHGEISRQLKLSGATAIVTAAEIAPVVVEAARTGIPSGKPFIVIEDGTRSIPDGTIPFKDLIARGKSLPSLPSNEVTVDDVAVLPYSSGTTGLPKGVMLSHKNLVANVEMLEHTGRGLFSNLKDTGFQEVFPLFLPFFHIFGMNGVALPRLADGAHVITLPKFVPENFLDVLENHKVSALFCVPPIVLFLSMGAKVKKSHIEHAHIAVSGAAPLSSTDVERFYEKFNIDDSKFRFCQGYGLTETSPVAFFEREGKKYSSIGKIVAGSDARLVDPITNEDVWTPGQTGELYVRGPHVMKGYRNNESATRETIVGDGWLKTGDIAYFDEEFDFFITDRLKELIKVKGFQVPPAELEALLRTHPEVQDAAVIGIPHERHGEVPKAFVVPKKDRKLQPEGVANFLVGKVSEYKELKGGVTFVDDIPRNPSGKILRSQLKNEYLSKLGSS